MGWSIRQTSKVLTIILTIVLASACSTSAGKKSAKRGANNSGGDTIRLAPGFDGKVITVGSLAAQSGPFAAAGRDITAGNKLYWDALNAKGGIDGRFRVKLKVADTQYFESVATLEYDAMRDHVIAFNDVSGTKSVVAVLPRLHQDKMLAVPAAADGRWVYDPNLLPVGTPPEVDAANVVAYWNARGEGGPFCALHQDDTYGTAGYAGAIAASRKLGIRIVAAPTFEPIPSGYGIQISELAAAGCRAVLFIGSPLHALGALDEARRRGYSPRWILGAGSWSRAIIGTQPLASYVAEQTWVVGSAVWGDKSVAGMPELLDAYKRYGNGIKPSSDVIEGYLQSMALRQVLEKAVELGDLSRSGMRTASTKVGAIRFGGLAGAYRYGPRAQDRVPPRASQISLVDPKAPGGLRVIDPAFRAPFANKVPLPDPPWK